MWTFTLEGIEPVSEKPYPYTELQKQWLAALKSGKYKQGQGFLKAVSDRFCCLGVLCELAGWEPKLNEADAIAYSFRDPQNPEAYTSTSYLPGFIRRMANLGDDIGRLEKPVRLKGLESYNPYTSLASMNDVRIIERTSRGETTGLSFPEIAAYIEHDPWNVFLPPEAA